MPEPTLKPCHICGSSNLGTHKYGDDTNLYYWAVSCCGCEHEGPPRFTADHAQRSWNTVCQIHAETKLGPCPFCGKDGAHLFEQARYWEGFGYLHDAVFWNVECSDCGARGVLAQTPEETAAAWNRVSGLQG